MVADVIALPRRRGRPSVADELRLELDSREFEERRYATQQEPLIRRLTFYASEHGPAAQQTVAALDALATRHRRRWEPQSEDAA